MRDANFRYSGSPFTALTCDSAATCAGTGRAESADSSATQREACSHCDVNLGDAFRCPAVMFPDPSFAYLIIIG